LEIYSTFETDSGTYDVLLTYTIDDLPKATSYEYHITIVVKKCPSYGVPIFKD